MGNGEKGGIGKKVGRGKETRRGEKGHIRRKVKGKRKGEVLMYT